MGDGTGVGTGTGAGVDTGVGAAAGPATGTGGDGFITLDGVEKVFQVRRRTGLLRRERREVRAVDGISFRVARGEMVGYIGPNGAGKS
ncbi:methionine ABC transporter ATP-binding protein, partial [Streptomyces sp. SID7499]|nr:methionine ABC transporter ATP-binding protein [Streptomyces sp. SID7499]